MKPEEFFHHLWEDYIRIAPKAAELKKAVEERGEEPQNDHIAFRTYNIPPINLESLEPHILSLGYERYEPYKFEQKKLRANGYIHPEGFPRIFLSELETENFSDNLRSVVKSLCSQADPKRVNNPDVMWAGRLWNPISYQTYLDLREESEYAAWVAAIGLRANHFTISINSLKTFEGIHDFADWLEKIGYELNTSGGRVKGSPDVLLEQGSTLADQVEQEFAGGEKHVIPTCYYEFAKRYPTPDGNLYQGFVAASADKIFESTDSKNR